MTDEQNGGSYPPRSGRHRVVIWGGIILCCLVAVAGIALAVAAFRDWRMNVASASWPTTKAEVINCKLTKRIFPPTRYSEPWENYTLEIGLRYAVDGTAYTSVVKLPVVAPPTIGADPSSVLAPVAPGRQIAVHYDPRDPATIVVLHGHAKAPWPSMGIGALLAAASFLFIPVLRSNLANKAT